MARSTPFGRLREQEPSVEGERVDRSTAPAREALAESSRSELVEEAVPGRRPRARLGALVRIGFGIIWLVDAYLKWQPSFQNGLPGVIGDGASSQPAWLAPWFNFNQMLLSFHPRAWAIGIAAIETALGLLLVLGLLRKLTYTFGAIWSLLIWATAEGFGHPNPGMPWTDIGTAIMYTFIFLALLALDAEVGKAQAGTRPYSLDESLERRVPGWRRIAEIRR